MSEKAKKETKKTEKAKNKTKLIAILLSIAGIVLVAVVTIILTSVSFSTKSYDEVDKLLKSARYNTYYRFDGNTYDKNGTCYKYDYSERETCEREIGTYDTGSIRATAVNKDTNYEISYYHYADNESTEEQNKNSLSIERDIDDDNSYIYSLSEDGSEEYLEYFKHDKEYYICYVIYKTENSDNKTPCNETDKKALINYQNEVNNLLGGLGLSKNDLFVYFSEYVKQYAIPKYQEAQKSLETKLPYSAIQNYIKDAGFRIEKKPNGVLVYNFITTNVNYYFLVSLDNDDKTALLTYTDKFYDGYSLIYDLARNQFVGTNNDSSCYYLVGELSEMPAKSSERVLRNSYCSEKNKEQSQSLYYSYQREIGSMSITRDELFSFAEEYYKKN